MRAGLARSLCSRCSRLSPPPPRPLRSQAHGWLRSYPPSGRAGKKAALPVTWQPGRTPSLAGARVKQPGTRGRFAHALKAAGHARALDQLLLRVPHLCPSPELDRTRPDRQLLPRWSLRSRSSSRAQRGEEEAGRGRASSESPTLRKNR
ncbi:hypothetical protein STEG23_032760 [Scotinomys teguina]